MDVAAHDSRARLLAQKQDLLAALKLLEQDREDGTVDEAAYRRARQRYEQEAAEVLERLDQLATDEEVAPRPKGGVRSSRGMLAGAGVLLAGAFALFLTTATHPRTGNASITGDIPTVAPSQKVSPQVAAAQRAVERHPQSYQALLSLGTAYVQSGDAGAADRTYLVAMKLRPQRPEAVTLHAMMLGSAGSYQQALALLHQVEAHHPGYARAWLLDGLLSTHSPRGYGRAIVAWQRFLVLQPHSKISPRVRKWIVAARKAKRATK